MNRIGYLWIGLSVFLSVGVASAEMRTFTSADGSKTFQGDIQSHKGGKITIRMANGRDLEVAPNIFSIEDQTYIADWMKKTPPKVDYHFRVEADKKKISGDRQNLGYKKVNQEKWSYDISITNGSRDTVSGLTVLYRVFYRNQADGEYSAGSDSGILQKNGDAKVPSEVKFNQEIQVRTDPVALEMVDYGYSSGRYKDSLLGCMVRIVDAQGEVVFDWKSTSSNLKTMDWDSTSKGKKNQPRGTVQVR